MLVEVLTFEGCPHGAPALELANATVAELGVEADVRLVFVEESQTQQVRLLGSPSIRVDGNDVELGADRRKDFSHSCRLYLTSQGPSAVPEAAWIRRKLTAS